MTNLEISESRQSSPGKQIVRSTTFVSMSANDKMNEKRFTFDNISQQPTKDARENITFMTFVKSNKDHLDESKAKSTNSKSISNKNFHQDTNNNEECYSMDSKTIVGNNLDNLNDKKRLNKTKRSNDSKDGLGNNNRKTCLVTTV